MEKIKNLAPWVITAFLAVLLFFKGCGKDSNNNTVTKEVKSDTVYVDKIVKIPAITENIINIKPEPIKEYVKEKSKDTLRTYKNTYTDSTGVASVTVFDSVSGKLLEQAVNIHVKEREIKYKEKIITNTETIKKKPNFILSAGLSTTTGVKPIYGAEITLKNSTGWNLDLGYNLEKQITIGIKKDLITSYKKN